MALLIVALALDNFGDPPQRQDPLQPPPAGKRGIGPGRPAIGVGLAVLIPALRTGMYRTFAVVGVGVVATRLFLPSPAGKPIVCEPQSAPAD